MGARGNDRLVYSTGAGNVCPRCGWAEDHCRCGKRGADEPVPVRVVAGG